MRFLARMLTTSLVATFAVLVCVAVDPSEAANGGTVVRDQILSRASYFETSGCQLIKIDFNFPTRYVSHYPFDHGTELRIELDALSIGAGDAPFERRREALDTPKESHGVLAAIVYEGNTIPRPILTLTFRRDVAFKVAQGDDFRSLIVAIARPMGSGVCEPVFPATE